MKNFVFIDNFGDGEPKRVVASNEIEAKMQVLRYLLENDVDNYSWDTMINDLDIQFFEVEGLKTL